MTLVTVFCRFDRTEGHHDVALVDNEDKWVAIGSSQHADAAVFEGGDDVGAQVDGGGADELVRRSSTREAPYDGGSAPNDYACG